MLSLAPIINAQDKAQLPDSIQDSEAFFLFLANSVEDEGELITPLDLEEMDIKGKYPEEIENKQAHSQRQEEAL